MKIGGFTCTTITYTTPEKGGGMNLEKIQHIMPVFWEEKYMNAIQKINTGTVGRKSGEIYASGGGGGGGCVMRPSKSWRGRLQYNIGYAVLKNCGVYIRGGDGYAFNKNGITLLFKKWTFYVYRMGGILYVCNYKTMD